jgi:hypothetical protein
MVVAGWRAPAAKADRTFRRLLRQLALAVSLVWRKGVGKSYTMPKRRCKIRRFVRRWPWVMVV